MRSWAEIDGRLTLAGVPGLLSLDMPVTQALNLMYAARLEGLNGEQRAALDAQLRTKIEDLPKREEESQRKRREAVLLVGDIG